MPSARDWWRRVTAAVKDKHSVYMAMVSLSRRGGQHRSHDMEAAVIRATSHSERYIDYKNAGRVFAWARTSPSFMSPLMWAIARRAECTRSWPVALKCLLLAHGLLLISPISTTYSGRLPFDSGTSVTGLRAILGGSPPSSVHTSSSSTAGPSFCRPTARMKTTVILE